MEDFFQQKPAEASGDAPLSTRMRPQTLEDYVGQNHILGPGKLLRRAIEADRVSSLILFGPPGTGKTTLAQIIAGATRCKFERLSGVESNVADIRRVVAQASQRRAHGVRTILFIDEIHRFNKAQQDVLLPEVENGVVRLIGATTQNPFFSINSALVSRSQIFELKPLAREDLLTLIHRALADPERGLGKTKVSIAPDAAAAWWPALEVARLPLPNTSEARSFGMVWPRSSVRARAIELLVDHARRVMAERERAVKVKH